MISTEELKQLTLKPFTEASALKKREQEYRKRHLRRKALKEKLAQMEDAARR